jgi:peptide/nickel transport system substrate-binding protein
MLNKKLAILTVVVLIAPLILSACGPTPEPVVIKETSVVIETVVVEQEGQTVVQEATRIVEKEVVVTATPEPEATTPPMAAVAPEFKNPDTYVVVEGAGEQQTLDPSWTYETRGGAIEQNIYEGLVFYNKGRTDQFIPALATDWTTSEDGKTWTFNMRDGVTFHAGGTLEPHDVAYSVWRGILQGRVDGPQWMTYEAFFGSDLAMGSIKDFALAYLGKDTETTTFDDLTDAELTQVCEAAKAAVEYDDAAGTVTYYLKNPQPWFLALLSQPFFGAILDQEWMVENGDWDGDCATWTQFADPAEQDSILFDQSNGTGPYMLDHWTPGEETVLTANENYWRTEPMWDGGPSGVASIKTVVLKNIPEWGTRLAMLEAGDADYIYAPAQYRPQLEPYYGTVCYADGSCEPGNADGYILVYRDLPTPAMTPAQFNWQINVEGGNQFAGSGALDGNGIPADFFSDLHIRKAFSYCFDYDTMIKDALNGEGIQAQGPIIQGMMGYREGEAPLYSYDPAKCEEEFKLADANHNGVPAGEDPDDVWDTGFYFQLGYNTGNDTRRLASEILKAGLEAVNPKFSVAVVGMPWPVLLNTRTAGKLPIYVGGWLEDYHDPNNWVNPFLSSQGAYGRVINMTKDYADKYDALILQGVTATDPAERTKIYEDIQLQAEEDAIVIWMYQVVDRYHFQKWIQGFYFNPAYSAAWYSWVYALSKVAP